MVAQAAIRSCDRRPLGCTLPNRHLTLQKSILCSREEQQAVPAKLLTAHSWCTACAAAPTTLRTAGSVPEA